MEPVQPFDLVIFGGTGDLAARKLLPGLYQSFIAGRFPAEARIIALGRGELGRDAYLDSIFDKSRNKLGDTLFDEARWRDFSGCIDYQQLDADSDADFDRLAERLRDASGRTRIFYLSTSPALFSGICQRLARSGLAGENSRVVLEKPLGHDLKTSAEINACVESVFDESQIYRIDHYLGKEAVQNLLALRFGNAIFEPLWSHGKIRDVQITISETLGVEGRGEFYDGTGALRDMLQNHLMQLLCIVAMEPPISMDADNVRDEKLKVIRSLEPFTPESVIADTVRGQYQAGRIDGADVAAYRDEPGIAEDSNTETFVALKARINNWRWAGVPFYLRTGKRMHRQVAEIVINFYSLPHAIFPTGDKGVDTSNRLYLRLQPNEAIELHLMAKQAGDENRLKPVKLDLDLTGHGERHSGAYERLLMDVARGNQTLFVRRDESDAAWRWVTPIMKTWAALDKAPEPYAAGSNGPEAAFELMRRDARRWIDSD